MDRLCEKTVLPLPYLCHTNPCPEGFPGAKPRPDRDRGAFKIPAPDASASEPRARAPFSPATRPAAATSGDAPDGPSSRSARARLQLLAPPSVSPSPSAPGDRRQGVEARGTVAGSRPRSAPPRPQVRHAVHPSPLPTSPAPFFCSHCRARVRVEHCRASVNGWLNPLLC